MISRTLSVAFVVVVLAGCASLFQDPKPIEQRSTHGPTAKTMWTYRIVTQNGREPNFEEQASWNDQLERSISRYLNEHPEAANSLDVSTFRFEKQVTVGMTQEQVLMLLGPPDKKTGDQAEIEKLARKFWPMIQGHATEAWTYPLGWRVYFAEMKVVDITQYLTPKD